MTGDQIHMRLNSWLDIYFTWGERSSFTWWRMMSSKIQIRFLCLLYIVHGQETSSLSGPSAATFSRARYKLDLLTMLARRWFWSCEGYEAFFIGLCCLAPQNGYASSSSTASTWPVQLSVVARCCCCCCCKSFLKLFWVLTIPFPALVTGTLKTKTR